MSSPTDDPRPLILYVDDELPNRIVFEQSLASEFRIRSVADGPSALDVLASVEVAVLVTDMRMPKMTGNELLAQVKERWPNTVRVVITAYRDVDPILRAVNDGLVARYVVKPWQLDDLQALLRWAVETYTLGRESGVLQARLLGIERLATLGSVSSAVLHDLRAPLVKLSYDLKSLGELARAVTHVGPWLEGVAPDPTARAELREVVEELPALVTDVGAAVDHMFRVTDGMSEFARREPASETALTENPNAVISLAMSICRHLLLGTSGELLYVGPSPLPAVEIASTELTQVLINLMSNACQAVREGARRGGRIELTARVDAKWLRIVIRDDAGGMSSEVLARIGKPFYSTRAGGIGLGVAQCHRLIGKAGGAVDIESTEGLGTTVTVAIPRAATA